MACVLPARAEGGRFKLEYLFTNTIGEATRGRCGCIGHGAGFGITAVTARRAGSGTAWRVGGGAAVVRFGPFGHTIQRLAFACDRPCVLFVRAGEVLEVGGFKRLGRVVGRAEHSVRPLTDSCPFYHLNKNDLGARSGFVVWSVFDVDGAAGNLRSLERTVGYFLFVPTDLRYRRVSDQENRKNLAGQPVPPAMRAPCCFRHTRFHFCGVSDSASSAGRSLWLSPCRR